MFSRTTETMNTMLWRDVANLAAQMGRVGKMMLERPELAEHGKELLGASELAWDWATNMRKTANDKIIHAWPGASMENRINNMTMDNTKDAGQPAARRSQAGVSPHCVNCQRWEGKHWYNRGRCSLLRMQTARGSTCEQFEVWPSLRANA